MLARRGLLVLLFILLYAASPIDGKRAGPAKSGGTVQASIWQNAIVPPLLNPDPSENEAKASSFIENDDKIREDGDDDAQDGDLDGQGGMEDQREAGGEDDAVDAKPTENEEKTKTEGKSDAVADGADDGDGDGNGDDNGDGDSSPVVPDGQDDGDIHVGDSQSQEGAADQEAVKLEEEEAMQDEGVDDDDLRNVQGERGKAKAEDGAEDANDDAVNTIVDDGKGDIQQEEVSDLGASSSTTAAPVEAEVKVASESSTSMLPKDESTGASTLAPTTDSSGKTGTNSPDTMGASTSTPTTNSSGKTGTDSPESTTSSPLEIGEIGTTSSQPGGDADSTTAEPSDGNANKAVASTSEAKENVGEVEAAHTPDEKAAAIAAADTIGETNKEAASKADEGLPVDNRDKTIGNTALQHFQCKKKDNSNYEACESCDDLSFLDEQNVTKYALAEKIVADKAYEKRKKQGPKEIPTECVAGQYIKNEWLDTLFSVLSNGTNTVTSRAFAERVWDPFPKELYRQLDTEKKGYITKEDLRNRWRNIVFAPNISKRFPGLGQNKTSRGVGEDSKENQMVVSVFEVVLFHALQGRSGTPNFRVDVRKPNFQTWKMGITFEDLGNYPEAKLMFSLGYPYNCIGRTLFEMCHGIEGMRLESMHKFLVQYADAYCIVAGKSSNALSSRNYSKAFKEFFGSGAETARISSWTYTFVMMFSFVFMPSLAPM